MLSLSVASRVMPNLTEILEMSLYVRQHLHLATTSFDISHCYAIQIIQFILLKLSIIIPIYIEIQLQQSITPALT